MSQQQEGLYDNYTYEIIAVTNNENLNANVDLVEKFFLLYQDKSNFPDPDELEAPQFIKDRIAKRSVNITKKEVIDNEPDPFTHLLCFNLISSSLVKTFAAGCIVEFYPDSQCVLITYLFVDVKYRGIKIGISGRKIGEIILKDKKSGLPNLLQLISEEYGKVVKAVLFESNNPSRTKVEEDSIPPSKRLSFFKRMGAKRVGFNYVQPPLGDGLNPVKNLFLLCFPELTKIDLMPVQTIMLFLIELTKSLDKNKSHQKYGVDNYYDDMQLLKKLDRVNPVMLKGIVINGENIIQQMLNDLIANAYEDSEELELYLKEIPRTEDPKFYFKRASICFEYLIDEDYSVPNSKNLLDDDIDSFNQINQKHWLPEIFLSLRSGIKYIWWTLLGKENLKKGEQKKNRKKQQDESDFLRRMREVKSYCTVCHSYETDLFSYKNQINPPFYTKYYALKSNRVLVRFPESIDYTSEGRREAYCTLEQYLVVSNDNLYKYIPMNLNISYSYFYKSKIRVWHIVLSSLEDYPINELEIIKLSKFFTGTQESKSYSDKKSTILENIKFASIADEEELSKAVFTKFDYQTFTEFLFGSSEDKDGILDVKYKISQQAIEDEFFDESDKYLSLDNLKTGVIQIDLGASFVEPIDNTKMENLTKDLPNLFEGLYEKVHSSKGLVQQIYKDSTLIFDALCGITLGIFDYDRMGYEEVEDTLSPREASVTESSFLSINRGTLTSYSLDDDVLDSAWNLLGVSPYLIIPSAVLSQNEYVSIDADKRLDFLLKISRDRQTRNNININELIADRDEIDDLLNNDFLDNPFHYKTERDLYDYGLRHRGIEARFLNAKAMLLQLDTIIDQRQNDANNTYQRNIQFFLAIIGLVQLFSIISALVDDSLVIKEWAKRYVHTSDKIYISFWLFLSAFILLLLPLIFWEIKARKSPLLWKLLSRKDRKKLNVKRKTNI